MRIEACSFPIDMQWGIYELYESMLGKVASLKGLSATDHYQRETRMLTIIHSLVSI